jgi:phosphoribosyl-ATP pyrophosphohydrolase / phosphoribosyl-AMP cyclohydrolase / histidinol dehydrogenase
MGTTLPLPLIAHIDLTRGPPFQEGLTREQLSYLSCVYFTIGDNEVDKLLGFLRHHVSMQAYINATNISALDSIISILDAGARIVFVQSSRLAELESYGSRVALATSNYETNLSPNGVLVVSKDDLIDCESILESYAESKTPSIFLYTCSEGNTQAYVDLARKHSAIPIIPATKLTMDNTNKDGRLSVPEIIETYWVSDRSDHLIPTLVTDERGIALGLVYSSQESLSESLKGGKGVAVRLLGFYSKSSNVWNSRSLSKSKTGFVVQGCYLWGYSRTCESISRL